MSDTPNSLEQAKAYDYITPIDEAATSLSRIIIEELYERRTELLVTDKYKKENKELVQNATDEFTTNVMKKIAESGIPYYFASTPFQKLTFIFDDLKNYISNVMGNREQELIALTLGIQSPANGKYRKEDATVNDLFLKLDEARKMRGTTEIDFFNDLREDPEAQKLADENKG